MRQYILGRAVSTLLMLLGVSLIIFVLIRLVPGDVVDVLFGTEAQGSPEQRLLLRQRYGLDQPLPVQYGLWLAQVARGDMGQVIRTGEPVSTHLVRRLPVTVQLSVFALSFALLVAVPAALVSAHWPNTWLDLGARVFGLVGLSIPNFWIATLLLLCSSLWLRWLPPMSWVSITDNPGQNLLQMIFPTLSLGMILVAAIMRMLRATLVEVLQEPYITTARAKGLPGLRVLYGHALKNSFIPVVTIIGVQMGYLLGGTVVTEQIFSLPGLGMEILWAVSNREYALLQGVVLLFSLLFAGTNLIVDLIYGYLDPRIRYE